MANWELFWFPTSSTIKRHVQPVAEHGVVPPYRWFNRTFITQSGRRLCIPHTHPTNKILSKYARPANASDGLFLMPVKCQGCQHGKRTEPSNGDAQGVTAVKGEQA